MIVDKRYGEVMDVKDFIFVTEEVRELATIPIEQAMNVVYSIKYPYDAYGNLDDTHRMAAFVRIGLAGQGFYWIQRINNTDFWQFPYETINLGCGDCEDTSFLLAAVLEAKKIPYYVVLGEVKLGNTLLGYHAWVHAKLNGSWTLIETTLDGKPTWNVPALSSPQQEVVTVNGLTYKSYVFFNRNETVEKKSLTTSGRIKEKHKINEIKARAHKLNLLEDDNG